MTPGGVPRQHHARNTAIGCINLNTTTITVAHVPTQNGARCCGGADARDVVPEIHAVHVGRQLHRGARPRDAEFSVAHRLRLHAREIAVVRHVAAVQVVVAGKQIIAGRLATRDAVRRIRGQPRGQLIRDACLGIEEHPINAALVDPGVGVGLVAELRVAPLQVGKPAGLTGVQRQLGKGARVLLVAGVVVQRGGRLQVAAVRALVRIGIDARVHTQRAALHIVRTRHAIPRMGKIKTVAIGQIKVIVVAAGRVAVHRGAHRPTVLQGARVRQRHHLLAELVALIRLERIEAAVRGQLLQRGAGVRERIGQQAHQRGELHHIARAKPAGAHERRASHHAAVVAVAVGAQRTGPAVHREFAVGEPRIERRTDTLCPERSHLQLHIATGISARHRHRFKVHAARKRRRARGARAHTALHLYRLHVRHEVGQVGEVQHLIFHVVQWHAVERDVDARLVEPAQAQIAVAPVGTGFGVRRHGRGGIHQQHGHILPEVALRDLGAADGALRDGRLAIGADGAHQHALNAAHRVGFGGRLGAVGTSLCAKRSRRERQEVYGGGRHQGRAQGGDTKSPRAPMARDCVQIHRLDSLRRYEPDQVLRDSLSQRALAAPAPRSCAVNPN